MTGPVAIVVLGIGLVVLAFTGQASEVFARFGITLPGSPSATAGSGTNASTQTPTQQTISTYGPFAGWVIEWGAATSWIQGVWNKLPQQFK